MSSIKWALDPMHSEISFKVKHLMITTVTGYFKTFNVEVETENENFDTASKIAFSADVDSIDTNNEQRNAHLKSADFFNAEEHKQIVFEGKNYKSDGSEEAQLQGNLTIGKTTKPITLKVEFGGIVVDPYGQTKAGFTLSGKISRSEFGLTWNAVTEAGNIVVSDEIKLQAEIQLIKQA